MNGQGESLMFRRAIAAALLAGLAALLVLGEASVGELDALRRWVAARRAERRRGRAADSLEEPG